MVKNYLKTAYRNLIRNRAYTSINVLGLALGISCCIIIFLLVRFELSYDSMHQKGDRTYRITAEFQRANEIAHFALTPFPMAEALRNDFPELPAASQIYYNYRGYLRDDNNDNFIAEHIIFADEQFLDVFDFEIIAGKRSTSLSNPNTVVITDRIAKRVFGTVDPLGQRLTLNSRLELEVTGVVADPPQNSHIPFDILVSYESFTNDYYELEADINDWGHFDTSSTYVVLSEGQSPEDFIEQLAGFAIKYQGEQFSEYGKYGLQPLGDIHFNTRYTSNAVVPITDMATIYGFSAIGLILLVAACINFINLSTAQSIKRSREVGIRKVMGAFRGQLVYQFLGETFLVALLAALISIVFVEVMLPVANQLIGIELAWNVLSDFTAFGFLAALVLLVTLLGGIYPAVVLSGFIPVKVLRAKAYSEGGKGLSLRRLLVIVQFLIAQVLIISTIVTYNQVEYFKNKSLGFEPDKVLNFGTGILDSTEQQLFKNRLLQNSGIETVSWFSSPPTSNGHLYGPFRLVDHEDPTKHRTTHRSIDGEYLETFGLELAAGRDIDGEIGKTNPGILVNETLIRMVGIDNPADAIGRRLEGNWLISASTIVGVVKDFHNQSLHREIIPTIFFYDPQYHWRAAIKLEGPRASGAIAHLEDTFADMFPLGVMEYQLEDIRLAQFYEQENRVFEAFEVFSVIAILICCLGLFGLVSYVANQKVKEVGIRKVLGAKLGHILVLFGNQFFKPLLFAFLVAVPLGYYLMSDWLDNFTYSDEIGVGVFVITLLASMLVAGMTVSYHSLRAARTNPVDSLRYE